MKRKILCLAALFSLVACENLMDEIPRFEESEKTAEFYQELSQTAALLSRLPLGNEQMNEVLDAVKAVNVTLTPEETAELEKVADSLGLNVIRMWEKEMK